MHLLRTCCTFPTGKEERERPTFSPLLVTFTGKNLRPCSSSLLPPAVCGSHVTPLCDPETTSFYTGRTCFLCVEHPDKPGSRTVLWHFNETFDFSSKLAHTTQSVPASLLTLPHIFYLVCSSSLNGPFRLSQRRTAWTCFGSLLKIHLLRSSLKS